MRAAVALLLLTSTAATARAATALCVEVRADSEQAAMRLLVLDELGHHPSHRVVTIEAECQSHLLVEIFQDFRDAGREIVV